MSVVDVGQSSVAYGVENVSYAVNLHPDMTRQLHRKMYGQKTTQVYAFKINALDVDGSEQNANIWLYWI
jgi:hypothetical protein